MSQLSTDRATDAYEKLRELIVRGRLAPGSRIIETDIAKRLGVSRTPARAALQRLAQEGYIVSDGDGRRSRPTIAPLTWEDAEELFYIVGIIEGLAARWTAELEPAPHDRVVARLREANRRFAEKSHEKRPDFNELFSLDERFHRLYVEAGAGPRLLALHDSIKPQAERYARVYISLLTAQIPISVKEHNAIIEAIDAAEPEIAQRAVETNWRNAAARLSRVIADVGEWGSW
ncbi:MAG: GntR family transcriptional regulator [Gemmatimonadota bacterium]